METNPIFRNLAISAANFTSFAKAFAVTLSKIAFNIKKYNFFTDFNILYGYSLYPGFSNRDKLSICLFAIII
jgi:hypothetical protein